jgi:uncharacterized protein
MFEKLLPKEPVFFEIFGRQGEAIVECAHVLLALTEDSSKIIPYVEQIKSLEHKADVLTHHCMEVLHKSFITPFERDDIHTLTCSLDNIIDEIDAAAGCLIVYQISEIPSLAREFALVLTQASKEVHRAVMALRHLSRGEEIRKTLSKINRLENEADELLRKALGKLFIEEPDVRMIIKWKEIYEHLETATDHCDNVANVIEGIILEYA